MRVKPRLFDQGHRKNDVFTHLATLLTYVQCRPFLRDHLFFNSLFFQLIQTELGEYRIGLDLFVTSFPTSFLNLSLFCSIYIRFSLKTSDLLQTVCIKQQQTPDCKSKTSKKHQFLQTKLHIRQHQNHKTGFLQEISNRNIHEQMNRGKLSCRPLLFSFFLRSHLF